MPENKSSSLFSIFAILATILIIIGTTYFVISRQSQRNSQKAELTVKPSNTAVKSPVATAVDINKVKISGQPFIGNPQAPVTLALWFDYQCPFCKRFEVNTMPSIVKNYVNTGKVKLVFKDFAFLGPDSRSASLVARAVWEASPNSFYKWYRAMFAKQDRENAAWGTKADILALTKTIPGINVAKVEELLAKNTNKYQQAVEADKNEASSFGISGTPAMIIGQQLVIGAQPYSAIKQLIDLELVKK